MHSVHCGVEELVPCPLKVAFWGPNHLTARAKAIDIQAGPAAVEVDSEFTELDRLNVAPVVESVYVKRFRLDESRKPILVNAHLEEVDAFFQLRATLRV